MLLGPDFITVSKVNLGYQPYSETRHVITAEISFSFPFSQTQIWNGK